MPSAQPYINPLGATTGNATPTLKSLSSMEKPLPALLVTDQSGTHFLKTPTPPSMQHIWLITGPAGCGKSTVGAYIAKQLGLPYLEGDTYHPAANVQKMASGHALTDQDRWDWLINLRTAALRTLGLSTPTHSPSTGTFPILPPVSLSPPPAVIVTCSALRARYRDVMRIATYQHPAVQTHFLFLDAPESVLTERVRARTIREGHYMGAEMVHSQFESLEVPGEEESDVLVVDVSKTMDVVLEDALRRVRERMD